MSENYSSTSDDSDQNNNIISENQQVKKKKNAFPVPPSLPKSFKVKPISNEIIRSEEFSNSSKEFNSNKNIIKEALVT